jgi:hypothetical protein
MMMIAALLLLSGGVMVVTQQHRRRERNGAGGLAVVVPTKTNNNPHHRPRGNDHTSTDAGHHPIATTTTTTRVAFIGNSMLYFNDFPRFFTALAADSDRSVSQSSCLHGGGSIPSLMLEGNGMYTQFETEAAVMATSSSSSDDDDQANTNFTLYDYGACTVPQLLTGRDDRLVDPGYSNSDEPVVQLLNNGTTNTTIIVAHNQNPCRADPHYLQYATQYFPHEISDDDYWDYIIINDNTRDPARLASRAHSMQFLEAFYVPLLLQQRRTAVPIFLWTHAYTIPSSPTRNMTGLNDVANFTSLTGVGYRNYVQLLSSHLPASRSPKIAPVGLAFLLVYEERPDLWARLFHNADHLHASPSGTYLQGCIVYYTLFGQMPRRIIGTTKNSIDGDDDGGDDDDELWIGRYLWNNARMMQHAWEPPNPYPTVEMADYLYHVAERIMVHGEKPKTYIEYELDVVAYEG